MQDRRASLGRMSRDEAESLAVEALGFIAADADRLGRFLSLTGLGPDTLRQAAREKGFFGQVLGYLVEDEATLLDFAADSGKNPVSIAAAHALLAGPRFEREDP